MKSGKSLSKSRCLELEENGSVNLWKSTNLAKFLIQSRTSTKKIRSKYLLPLKKLK
jgi:hypothetical protein